MQVQFIVGLVALVVFIVCTGFLAQVLLNEAHARRQAVSARAAFHKEFRDIERQLFAMDVEAKTSALSQVQLDNYAELVGRRSVLESRLKQEQRQQHMKLAHA